jgi:hypothetical protein
MSDFEGAWEGKIKLMLGLALPQDSWASLYNNSANFITQTNLWNKLVSGVCNRDTGGCSNAF